MNLPPAYVRLRAIQWLDHSSRNRFFVRRGTLSRSWHTHATAVCGSTDVRCSVPTHILPESPVGVRDTQGHQGLNDRCIALGPLHHGSIVRGAPKPHRLTGPLNWKAAHRDEVRNQLPPLSRP